MNPLITFISPSEKESGTAGVKCAGGAVTVTGAPDWTGWCCVSIWTCGYGRTTTGSCFSSRGWMEPLGPMCSLGATSGSRLDSSLTREKQRKRSELLQSWLWSPTIRYFQDIRNIEIKEVHSDNKTYSRDGKTGNSGTASPQK